MRKLLTLLTSLSLTVSTGLIAVACTNPNEEIDNTPVDPEIEKEFLTELKTIPGKIAQKLDNRKKYTVLVDKEEAQKYDFFNLKYLSKTFKIDEENKKKEWNLKNETDIQVYKNKMISDLDRIFSNEDYINMLDGAFLKKPAYQKMYLGANETLGEYHLQDISDFKLTGQSLPAQVNEKEQVMYNIDFTFFRVFFYQSKDGAKSVINSNPQQLRLTISTQGIYAEALRNIQYELPNKILQDKDWSTQLKFLQLQEASMGEDGKGPIFKNYGKLDNAMKAYLISDGFQHKLQDTIQRILDDTQTNLGIVKLEPLKLEQLTMETSNTMLTSNPFNSVRDMTNFKDNALVNSLVMKSNNKNINYMKEEQAVKALKEYIDNNDNKFTNFNNELGKFLDNYNINIDDQKNMINETYSYGTFNLSNAKMQVTLAGKPIIGEFDLTATLPWIYSNDELQNEQSKANSMNKVDTFFHAMYDSLKVANEYMFQINPDPQKRTKTMLTFGSQEFKEDYLNNSEWVKKWAEVKAELGPNDGIEKSINMGSGYTQGNRGKSHYIIGQGTTNNKVQHKLHNNKNFKFDGDGFESYWNVGYFAYTTVFRKTSDGRYGIGMRDNDKFDKEVTYVIKLGNIRINVGFPFGKNPSGGWAAPGYESNDTDFFGGGRTQAQFVDEIMQNKKDFLFFEFENSSNT